MFFTVMTLTWGLEEALFGVVSQFPPKLGFYCAAGEPTQDQCGLEGSETLFPIEEQGLPKGDQPLSEVEISPVERTPAAAVDARASIQRVMPRLSAVLSGVKSEGCCDGLVRVEGDSPEDLDYAVAGLIARQWAEQLLVGGMIQAYGRCMVSRFELDSEVSGLDLFAERVAHAVVPNAKRSFGDVDREIAQRNVTLDHHLESCDLLSYLRNQMGSCDFNLQGPGVEL